MSETPAFDPPEPPKNPPERPTLKIEPATSNINTRNVRLLALGGILVGSFLPWATLAAPLVGEISKSGTSGDGIITAALAGLALLLSISGGSNSKTQRRVSLGASLVCGLIAFIDIADVYEKANEADLTYMQVGVGLWIVAGSSVAAIFSSLK